MPMAEPPVVEHAASEEAGAGGSLVLEGAGDITDTEMLAELYIAQGHPEKGLEVYRRLAAKEPHNLRLHENIIGLEEEGAGASRRPPERNRTRLNSTHDQSSYDVLRLTKQTPPV